MTTDEAGQLLMGAEVIWHGQICRKDAAVSYALGTLRIVLPDGFTRFIPVDELQEVE